MELQNWALKYGIFRVSPALAFPFSFFFSKIVYNEEKPEIIIILTFFLLSKNVSGPNSFPNGPNEELINKQTV